MKVLDQIEYDVNLPAWLNNMKFLIESSPAIRRDQEISLLAYFAPMVDRWIDETKADAGSEERIAIASETIRLYKNFCDWSVLSPVDTDCPRERCRKVYNRLSGLLQ